MIPKLAFVATFARLLGAVHAAVGASALPAGGVGVGAALGVPVLLLVLYLTRRAGHRADPRQAFLEGYAAPVGAVGLVFVATGLPDDWDEGLALFFRYALQVVRRTRWWVYLLVAAAAAFRAQAVQEELVAKKGGRR